MGGGTVYRYVAVGIKPKTTVNMDPDECWNGGVVIDFPVSILGAGEANTILYGGSILIKLRNKQNQHILLKDLTLKNNAECVHHQGDHLKLINVTVIDGLIGKHFSNIFTEPTCTIIDNSFFSFFIYRYID